MIVMDMACLISEEETTSPQCPNTADVLRRGVQRARIQTIRKMVGDYFLITGFLGEKTVKSSPFGGIWRRSARLDY